MIPIQILPISKSHIKGLNQLPPDSWEFDYESFLRNFLSAEFFYAFVMIQGERVVGTGNVFISGKVGWLANIVIAKESRRQGLGFRMTKFLVDFLQQKGSETQLLIATQLGEPVYRKIGFQKVTDYLGFESVVDTVVDYASPIRKLTDSDLESLYQLDQKTNGEHRSHLLVRYYKSGFGYFDEKDKLLGVYLPDFERGLVLATVPKAGIALLKIKHAQKGKRTMLPIENQSGIDFLEKSGLRKGTTFSRMILGKPIPWNPHFIYSYGSGYCG